MIAGGPVQRPPMSGALEVDRVLASVNAEGFTSAVAMDERQLRERARKLRISNDGDRRHSARRRDVR